MSGECIDSLGGIDLVEDYSILIWDWWKERYHAWNIVCDRSVHLVCVRACVRVNASKRMS